LAALENLLTAHELDGVWLDFIHWPGRWEKPKSRLYPTSFDAGTLNRFRADTGISAPPDELLATWAQEWQAWHCEQITDWVAQAAALVRLVAPGTTLGLFSVPWQEAVLVRVMGQDLLALAAHVDVFSPMVYHRMCGRPVEWSTGVAGEVAAKTGRPVWPIIQAVDEPDTLPDDEFNAAPGRSFQRRYPVSSERHLAGQPPGHNPPSLRSRQINNAERDILPQTILIKRHAC